MDILVARANTKVIKYIRLILTKGLAIGNVIYSCIFFKKINWNWSFLCFKRLSALYSWLIAAPGTFSLQESLWVSTPYGVFSSQARSGKRILTPLVNILAKKIHLRVHITHSSVNSTLVALQIANIWLQTSVQAWNTLFNLVQFWIASNEIFWCDWIFFAINQIQTIQRFYLWKKI